MDTHLLFPQIIVEQIVKDQEYTEIAINTVGESRSSSIMEKD